MPFIARYRRAIQKGNKKLGRIYEKTPFDRKSRTH